MNDRRSRLVQSESGQAMVEFALTITLTLLLIFGMIDFSRAVYTASVIQWAAQKGARVGIVDSSQIESVVLGRMVGLDTSQVVITTPDAGDGIVQVDVTYQFEFIVPLVTAITGESIQMSASASMVAY